MGKSDEKLGIVVNDGNPQDKSDCDEVEMLHLNPENSFSNVYRVITALESKGFKSFVGRYIVIDNYVTSRLQEGSQPLVDLVNEVTQQTWFTDISAKSLEDLYPIPPDIPDEL